MTIILLQDYTTNPPVQLHPSSLDFSKKRFGERCHVYLRGHKKTLPVEEIMSCCCCGNSDTEEECHEETSFIKVRRTLSSSNLKFRFMSNPDHSNIFQFKL